MRRLSILAATLLLTLFVTAPGVAQDFEVFDLRVIAFDGYQPDVLENVRVSVDSGIELPGCDLPLFLEAGSLRLEVPDTDLELDTDSDPFSFLFLLPSLMEDPDIYSGRPFTEMLFTGFTQSGRGVSLLVDFAGDACTGPVPANWVDEVLGGGLELVVPGSSALEVQWSGYFDSLGALTPDEFVSCADEGLTGALFGLCNAYCEAMMCGTDEQQASDKACSAVARNYMKKSGGTPPPCYVGD